LSAGTRYLADDDRSLDRSILSRLEAAGWIDVGHARGGTNISTVPARGFRNTEFATMRCDFVMASKAMAVRAIHYEVIRTPVTDIASDHYPVLARFELNA
jgi:exodeoxyribonuclease-3